MDKPLRFCLELELCAKNSFWTAHSTISFLFISSDEVQVLYNCEHVFSPRLRKTIPVSFLFYQPQAKIFDFLCVEEVPARENNAEIKTADIDFTFHLAVSGCIDDTSCLSALPDINRRYYGSGVTRRRGPAVHRSPRSFITFQTSNSHQNQTQTSRSEKSADRRT